MQGSVKVANGASSCFKINQNDAADWKAINNIIQLNEAITCIRFYSGNIKEMKPSVLRCKLFFKLLQSRFVRATLNEDPRKVALKRYRKVFWLNIIRIHITAEKSESLLNDGNSNWYSIKNSVRQHVHCNGQYLQLNFDALQHAAETCRKRK